MVKKIPDKESYLQSRKWLLDAYDVAAATRPEACRMRVIEKDSQGVIKPERGGVKAPAPSIRPGKGPL
jgi:hypothetical protein